MSECFVPLVSGDAVTSRLLDPVRLGALELPDLPAARPMSVDVNQDTYFHVVSMLHRNALQAATVLESAR